MRRQLTFLLALAMLFSLTACGGTTSNQESPAPSESSQMTETSSPEPSDDLAAEEPVAESPEETPEQTQPSEGNQSEPSQPSDELLEQPQPSSEEQQDPAQPPAGDNDGNSNILIAYFTWADNTVVENPSSVDVDATTSASVLAPGNAAKLASWIQQEVGGDLHSIVVEEPYSSDYDECLDRAADEKAENARPALASHVDNMEDYDIVFLGFPNWWYTLPMPVLTFVEEYDWSGKTVVPFVTHGTGGLSGTIRDLTAALPEDVTILDPIGVYRPEVDASQSAVQAWIAGLDLEV